MTRAKPFTLEECTGERYPDLATVQRLALSDLAADLAAIFKAMLATGELIQENGKIIPNPGKESYA
jgi:hypothetical protein